MFRELIVSINSKWFAKVTTKMCCSVSYYNVI